jgi:glutamate-1-semialdehyde 2,1-aminomutase
MAAGLTSLRKLKSNPNIYDELNIKAKRVTDGFKDAATAVGVNMTTDTRGSMFGFFFSDKIVKNFAEAQENDTKMFAKFHKGMLDRGIYLACSSFEAGFISTATTDEMIDSAIEAAKETLKEITA